MQSKTENLLAQALAQVQANYQMRMLELTGVLGKLWEALDKSTKEINSATSTSKESLEALETIGKKQSQILLQLQEQSNQPALLKSLLEQLTLFQNASAHLTCLAQQLIDHQAQPDPLIPTLQAEVKELKTELNNLKLQIPSAASVEQLIQQIASLKTSIEQLQTQMKSTEELNKAREKSIDTWQASWNVRIDLLETMLKISNPATHHVQELKTRLSALESWKENLENTRNGESIEKNSLIEHWTERLNSLEVLLKQLNDLLS